MSSTEPSVEPSIELSAEPSVTPSVTPSLTPSVSERLDALKFLAQTHRILSVERAKASNRLLVGVFGFYVLAIASRFGSWSSAVVERALTTIEFQVAVWVLFVLLAVYSWYTLWRAKDADGKNRRFAVETENEIRRLVASPEYSAIWFHERSENINQNITMRHGVVIVMLAVIAAFLLTMPIPR